MDKPVNLAELLGGYVELSQPATTRDIQTLINSTASNETRSKLQYLIDNHSKEVSEKRISILDLLETHTDTNLSLGAFLRMLPVMRVRQYSISSSPLWNSSTVSGTPYCADSDIKRADRLSFFLVTISVVAPIISGRNEHFLGVSSNYLANLRPGDRVQMLIRQSNAAFHPPSDPMTPVVMFCAGSGLAPMRAFLQDRAAQKQSGRQVSPALLFFGCRSPDHDYLYSQSDLKEWQEMGIVDVRPAFSRASAQSENCKYVQE